MVTEPEPQKTEIAEAVARLFHALDDRDWATVHTVTAEHIDVDYPSKQGGPERLSAHAFVTGLREFLPGFDETHHLLGPIVVDRPSQESATARFHARVTHLVADQNAPLWTIGCHYTFGLTYLDGSWRISSSRVRVLYDEGNRDIEQLARVRATAPG